MNGTGTFDVIIIGGSYAGMAAGMALGRAMRKVLIIDGGNPCNKPTPHSHNFLTNDGKTPQEIISLSKHQLGVYKTVQFHKATVTDARQTSSGFEVQCHSGEMYSAGKLVFATGILDIMPDIPGFAECWGKTVLHCPYCHGYEIRHQKTGILGNGEQGYEFATLISNWTGDLTVYTNGASDFTTLRKEILFHKKIKITEKSIAEIKQKSGHMQGILFTDGTFEPLTGLYARPLFVQHSMIPLSLGCQLTSEGYLSVDSSQRTTNPEIYACGDNSSRMRTVANAVSTGTTTGMMVNRALIEQEFRYP